jgi:hypothetical protein
MSDSGPSTVSDDVERSRGSRTFYRARAERSRLWFVDTYTRASYSFLGQVSQELTKDKLAEIINAVVFESGILSKVIRSELEGVLQRALGEYLNRELPRFLNDNVSKAVADCLGSEEVKLLIDSKFRAITLYLKTDVIPKVVKQLLQKG